MANILEKYLRKLGVKSFFDLNESEKETFRKWEVALQGRSVSDDEFRNFMMLEQDATIGELLDPDISKNKDRFLKGYLRLLRHTRKLASGPKVEKEMAEKQLETLTEQL